MKHYDHAAIERKWQAFWREQGLFRADRRKKGGKFYCLTMYPYPSGTLHIGHVINYTLGDAVVRYHLMKGENVLSPMGWDSFGLPAENAAIREGVHPAAYTAENIRRMKAQMIRAGWGYDWDREIATSHPGYYKWTQWIFLQLYENGLAYKKNALVNWCPSCETVLANEQVKNERCERCNSTIEQKELEQWFFRMSRYAQRLLDNHRLLKGKWPDRVLKMQEEWIGRSEGVLINFRLRETGETIPIFTTRPDTVFGVTFMAVSPHHPRLAEWLAGRPGADEVMERVAELRKQNVSVRNVEEVEKVGVDTGLAVVNPLNGDEVPLWVANFVLMEYGTGIIMAVPAHDQRDFEFARTYGLPVKVVIRPVEGDIDPAAMDEAYVDDGVMVRSGEFDGMNNRAAMAAITERIEREGTGRREVHYRLKDWLVSRQRYWGAPIPVVYCGSCGIVPVPERDLPVLLPGNVEFRPTGESPLARCEEFVRTTCPRCGGDARRETDTMDTFVDSSWYFLRYLGPRLEDRPFSRADVEFWMPVDQYIGGVEHATMHLVYFRFLTHVLHDLGHLPFEEPAERLFCQGMVLKTAYYCAACKWVREEDVDTAEMACRRCGGPVEAEMAKISKTKLNTVSPDEIMEEYGADAMRLNILSDNPPDQEQVWSEDSVKGAHRFLARLHALVEEDRDALNREEGKSPPDVDALSEPEKTVLRKVHRTIMRVTECIESSMRFNTALAAVNELVNLFKTRRGSLSAPVKRAVYEAVVQLLAPVTPHLAEELWELLGHGESVFTAGWPEADPAFAVEETVEMPVQVNGRVRARIAVSAGAPEEEVRAAALGDERVRGFIGDRDVKKVIVVPSRIVNIVV